MKKTISVILFLVLIINISAVCAKAENLPSLSARSAILINADDGTVLFSKNSDEKLPMASTTKIMTALVAIENCVLDKVVTADERSVGTEGSSIYLEFGEKLNLEQLLYALLLQSANDAASAIAVSTAGSIEEFARMMNSKAASLGLRDTHFTNPHGLDDEGHYTTAHDLALITSEALRNETFSKIVSTVKAEIPAEDGKRYLVNHNKLLREYEGCIGVKTGFTRISGRCLVSAAERDGLKLIAVTLSAPDDWNDHRKLLDFGFLKYEKICLSGDNGIIIDIPVTGAETEFIRCGTEINTSVFSLRSDETVKTELVCPRFLYAPVKCGDTVGKIIFRKGSDTISILTLKALESTE